MGKGGYRGGGSMIGPGGWFLGSRKALSGRDKISFSPHEEPPKEILAQPPKKWSPPRPRNVQLTEADVESLELAYLERIIDAKLRGENLPKFPELIRPKLEKSIIEAGGFMAWVESHDASEEIIAQKIDGAEMGLKGQDKGSRVLDVVRLGNERSLKIIGDDENAERLLVLFAEQERLIAARDEALEIVKKLRDRLAVIDQEINIRQR